MSPPVRKKGASKKGTSKKTAKTTNLKKVKSMIEKSVEQSPIGPSESYRHYERRMAAKHPEVLSEMQNRGLTRAEKDAMWSSGYRRHDPLSPRAGYTPGYPGKPGGGKSKSQKRKKG